MAVVVEEKVGLIASVTGSTADDTLLPVDLEMLLLPLGSHSRSEARVLGALAPLAAPYWLGAKPVGPLSLGHSAMSASRIEATRPPRLRAVAGRTRHGLTVYEGGRRD